MKRLLAFVAIALAGLIALEPGAAVGQKKGSSGKRGVDITDASPEQYALLAQYKEMVGTIRSATPRSIVFRVEYTHPVADSGTANANSQANAAGKKEAAQVAQLQKQIQKLQRDQVALQKAKNPAQLQQKLVQLLRDQQKLEVQIYRIQVQQVQQAQQKNVQALRGKGKLDKDYIDFELPLLEKATIRRLTLGVEYDDKGNLKEPNVAAKGAGGLPGFPATIDDLINGVPAKVYLVSPKSAAAAEARKKDENGALLSDFPPNRPLVRMIVMLGDSNGPVALPNAKAKKKK
jgi:hypothetical protein